MNPTEFLKNADLAGALGSLQQQVRESPADAKHRTFLFQLLSVTGEWKRALNQLNVAGELDASTLPMVQTYRELLQCEAFRAEVFAGLRRPTLFGEPVEWAALYLHALTTLEPAQSLAFREQAIEQAPLSSGSINGSPFDWLADADSRIGPILEAVVNGTYYWIPFQHIRKIVIEPPEDLRDMVWLAAEFTWANDGKAVGFIPARYPGSELSENPRIQLGRLTEWQELPGEHYAGIGQRMLLSSSDEYPLLEVREINFDT